MPAAWLGFTLPSALAMILFALGIQASGTPLAALYQPVWTGTILSPRDFGAALVAFVALTFWRVPPWTVVIVASVVAGWLAGI
ncbi:protein of unknown function [Burkholderia multivorans]